MKALSLPVFAIALMSAVLAAACDASKAQEHPGHEHEPRKIVATAPVAKDVVSTQQYVCQIHSRRHIEVRALESGYLDEIRVQEGQTVKRGDVMFKIVPVLYQASLATEEAEAELAQINYDNTKRLADRSVVSNQEAAMSRAELARAQAKVNRARAELSFTALRAPFDGIIDRQRQQQGSLVEEGDILTTVSDNEVMWVYFNVPETRYLQYKAASEPERAGMRVELQLANGEIFPHAGKIGAIEADFDSETGNIAFRADFPNPDGLLRHGQTGTILIRRTVPRAIVIPQRATYEILANKYVYVLEAGGDRTPNHALHGVVRQREVVIQDELDDIYVIKEGLSVNDTIIFEGILQVRDGDNVSYELRPPADILANMKLHAE